MTRFSATELLFGWTKATVSLAPMLKLDQLIATFCEDCLTVTTPGVVAIAALPAETTPPLGAARAAGASPSPNDPASAVAHQAPRLRQLFVAMAPVRRGARFIGLVGDLRVMERTPKGWS